MPSTLSFWLEWLWVGIRTLPDFLGNNWIGAVFALVFILIYETRNFLSFPQFMVAATFRSRLAALGAFLIDHWRVSVRLWALVLSVFLLLHTLDLVRRDSDTLTSKAVNLKFKVDENDLLCSASKEELRIVNAGLNGENKTLGNQNRDQQNTINNCQNQALHLLKPIEFRQTILPLLLTTTALTPGDKVATFLLITNKTIREAKLKAECNHQLDKTSRFVMVGVDTTSWGRPDDIRGGVMKAHIAQPDWSPDEPALAILEYKGQDNISCGFTQW